METSKKYALDLLDAGKAFIMAVLSAVLSTVLLSINAGKLDLNPKAIGMVALSAALSYLVKNFFQPATITIPVSTVNNPVTTYTISPVNGIASGNANAVVSSGPVAVANPPEPPAAGGNALAAN